MEWIINVILIFSISIILLKKNILIPIKVCNTNINKTKKTAVN